MKNKRIQKYYRRIFFRLFFLTIILVIPFFFIKPNYDLIAIELPTFLDEIAPEIILSGKEKMTILLGEEYVEPGYSATDNGKDLTAQVEVIDETNNQEAGTYTIEYIATDDNGNRTAKTRTIVVEKEFNFDTKDPDFYIRSLENYIKANGYKISLGFYNFDENYTYKYDADKEYYGASLIKPVVALYMYENLKPNTYQKQLIESAISRSNNEAYDALVNIVSVGNLKKYGENLGLTNFMTDKNNTSYSDTTVENQLTLWKKIWNFINSNSYGAELRNYLKNSNYNYLEFNNEIETLHKYGSWGENFHDAGIILGENPYIITMLTKEGGGNYPKIINDLSEKLYNFNKLIKNS